MTLASLRRVPAPMKAIERKCQPCGIGVRASGRADGCQSPGLKMIKPGGAPGGGVADGDSLTRFANRVGRYRKEEKKLSKKSGEGSCLLGWDKWRAWAGAPDNRFARLGNSSNRAAPAGFRFEITPGAAGRRMIVGSVFKKWLLENGNGFAGDWRISACLKSVFKKTLVNLNTPCHDPSR